MRVRYMIEYALRQKPDGSHWYQPIGVWARGEGPWCLDAEYIPEEELRWCDAQVYICGFIERGEPYLPEDILERWAATIGTYTGDCSPIYETQAAGTSEVAARVLAMLVAGERLGHPPLA